MDINEIEVWGYQGLKGTIPCKRQLLVTDGGLFPGIYSFKDGEALVFYRGTADHLNASSNISMKRSTDGGETWSEPQIVAYENDDRNPCVGIIENTVVMIYGSRINKVQRNGKDFSIDDYWKHSRWQVKYVRSDDKGHTWTDPKDVPNPPGYTLCSPGGGCNMFQLNFERLVAGVFGLAGNQQYTNQPLKEWVTFPMMYHLVKDKWEMTWKPIESGSDEVDFFQAGDDFGAMIRTGGVRFHACYTRVYDGYKWGKPRIAFPDGMHPARITQLPDKIIMATVGRRRYPYGAMVLLSRDYGKTWDWDNQFILADNCGNKEVRGDNGYASSTLLPNGEILSVWYKNISDAPFFEGTGDKYTLELAKYSVKDLTKWTQYGEDV